MGAVGHVSGLITKEQIFRVPGKGYGVVQRATWEGVQAADIIIIQHHHLVILPALCAEGYFDLN